ncbi:MAG: N-acetylmuramoyl-L-alanine amidase [Bacteroidales bacterium]|nr:N-acetylmuramoyl-L-alanine amidase [Bacteroidales bacterium]
MVKQTSLSIIFGGLLCVWSIVSFAQEQQSSSSNKFDKLVIDAGHGGDKPGAVGSKSKEKDITLAVSLKLGKMITENLKDVEVYYTRVIDKDVELYKRSQIANKIGADLFISIHCNSSTNKAPKGSETFALGLTKAAQNLEVAKKENKDILSEANYEENYDGFDPNAPENDILFSLYQNAYMEGSLWFADKVQKQLTANTPIQNRGVKQANFVVLLKSAMPSVLIEIGFISNKEEEEYLMSEIGQYEIAASIFRAICEYKAHKDNITVAVPEVTSLIPQGVIEKQKQMEESKRLALAKEQEALRKQQQINKEQQIQDSISNSQSSGNKVVYRVQFASMKAKLSTNDARFAGLEDVWLYEFDGYWKYCAGLFASRQEASNYVQKVRAAGHKDAFVVAFHNGKRISFEQAKVLENEK